jgi:hypothetical protein
MEKHVYAVFTNAASGKDEECTKWYVDEHVRDIVERYGFTSGQHFKFDMEQYFPDFPFRYVTFYEVPDSDFQRLHSEHAPYMRAHVASLDRPAEERPKTDMSLSSNLDLKGARSYWITALQEPELKD